MKRCRLSASIFRYFFIILDDGYIESILSKRSGYRAFRDFFADFGKMIFRLTLPLLNITCISDLRMCSARSRQDKRRKRIRILLECSDSNLSWMFKRIPHSNPWILFGFPVFMICRIYKLGIQTRSETIKDPRIQDKRKNETKMQLKVCTLLSGQRRLMRLWRQIFG